MPYDPSLPANGSPNSSSEMRGQLSGLKALIDALQSITAAQVDSVTTLNPEDPAQVTLEVSGHVLHLSFGIPRGERGEQGQQGGEGAQGPPFADVVVDGVVTLDPGSAATVTATFDGTQVHLGFGIPRGSDGGTGAQGEPGPPGEVTTTQMDSTINAAIAGTARNPNVAPLNLAVSDPPTQGEVQQILDKLNELNAALFRTP